MRFGSLFAGIGGFDLGLERSGMQCAWQVEIDPYAQKVLAKHWPDVRRHADVCTFPPEEGDWEVDLICGGFPCQDISYAGKGAGLAGARSGLWFQFARIIGDLRPRYVIVENVSALLTRGMGEVLGTLASLGYDAEWHVIPASAVGAPHRRDRVWIVAFRNADGQRETSHGISDAKHGRAVPTQARRKPARVCGKRDVADAEGIGRRAGLCQDDAEQDGNQSGDGCGDVPDSDRAGRQQQRRAEPIPAEQLAAKCGGWWLAEPDVGRVAHGVSARVDRLRCLGNAVVPQVVELIGRAIMERQCGERIVGSE
jgi:DNA (cytosine-5)-methyltransferase 1